MSFNIGDSQTTSHMKNVLIVIRFNPNWHLSNKVFFLYAYDINRPNIQNSYNTYLRGKYSHGKSNILLEYDYSAKIRNRIL